MSKHDKQDNRDGWGDLTDAARALEHELQRFEELASTARRIPLDGQRNIARAAKTTTETVEGQSRVDLALGALVRSITTIRERHERNAASLQARGEEIRVRAEEYASLFALYQELGEEGGAVNELVQHAAQAQLAATSPEAMTSLLASLTEIDVRMGALVDRARELVRSATTASFADLAGQADALRQQVAAARNKMGLLKRSLSPSAAGTSGPSTLH